MGFQSQLGPWFPWRPQASPSPSLNPGFPSHCWGEYQTKEEVEDWEKMDQEAVVKSNWGWSGSHFPLRISATRSQ